MKFFYEGFYKCPFCKYNTQAISITKDKMVVRCKACGSKFNINGVNIDKSTISRT